MNVPSLIIELRSAAATLRSTPVQSQNSEAMISAELIERAADALEAAQHTISPPAWSEFPNWVNFIAMDSDGRWHGFGREPYVEDSFGGNLMGWDVQEGGTLAYRDYNAPCIAGWENSLQRRPEMTA